MCSNRSRAIKGLSFIGEYMAPIHVVTHLPLKDCFPRLFVIQVILNLNKHDGCIDKNITNTLKKNAVTLDSIF
jgi:hypothetical protein